MHYIEYNVQNGIMAQTYCPEGGLLTYFLPMKAASRKEWAGERDSFFCCHGTMVQANAAWNHRLYYQEDDHLYVTMYADSQVSFEMQGRKILPYTESGLYERKSDDLFGKQCQTDHK